MTRLTITLPDDIYTWLQAQATSNHRSKNKQVIAILAACKKQAESRPTFSMADEQWLAAKGSRRK